MRALGAEETGVRTKVLVREVTNSPIISATPDDNIQEVAAKMAKFQVGSIVIFDGETPVGIVTDKDIVTKSVARNLKPTAVKVKEIMSSPIQTVESTKDITEAAKIMRKFGIKRLGVTYKDKLVGMVSMSDLLAVTPEIMGILSEKTRITLGETSKQKGYLAGYCDLCNQWSDFLVESDGKFLCDECRADARLGSSAEQPV